MRRWPVISAVSALAVVLLALPSGARAAAPQAPPGPASPEAGGRDRHRRRGRVDGPGRQPGRASTCSRTAATPIDAAVATASTLGVTIPFVAGPGRRRVHDHLPGPDPPGGDDRRPRELPGGVHRNHVHRPEDRPAARLQQRVRRSRCRPASRRWWRPGPRRVSLYGAPEPRPPTCGRPSRWPSTGSASTRTSSSSPSPGCRCCRPTRPATGCSDQGRRPAAGRVPAAQPGPGPHLPAAGPLRPVLPVRRAARPGHRPRRRPPGADARQTRGRPCRAS